MLKTIYSAILGCTLLYCYYSLPLCAELYAISSIWRAQVCRCYFACVNLKCVTTGAKYVLTHRMYRLYLSGILCPIVYTLQMAKVFGGLAKSDDSQQDCGSCGCTVCHQIFIGKHRRLFFPGHSVPVHLSAFRDRWRQKQPQKPRDDGSIVDGGGQQTLYFYVHKSNAAGCH